MGGGGLDDFLGGVLKGAGVTVTSTDNSVTVAGPAPATPPPTIPRTVSYAPLIIAVVGGLAVLYLVREATR